MQPPLEPPYASLVSHDLLGFLSINCLARSGPLDRDPCFKCCLETTNSCQRFFVVGGGGFALFCFVLFFKETFLLQHECGVNNWNAWPFFYYYFYWSIVDLQGCVNFCCTEKWFRYIYSFSYSFPLWFITGHWIQLPVLYSRTFVSIHPLFTSVHLLIPNSWSFPLPPPSPLGCQRFYLQDMSSPNSSNRWRS